MTNNRNNTNYENRRNDRYSYNEHGYNREYDNRREPEYVDIYSVRERAPRESRRPAPKKSGSGIMIAAVAFSLVAVIAATVFAVGAFNARPVIGNTAPTAAITAVAEKDANKNVQSNEAPAQQTAAKTDNQSAQQTAKTDAQPAQQTEDNIQVVNGERVYIDTKRTAPEKTGASVDYYANGKTSYGFDWNYSADNGNFVIRCDYNFNQQQYQFHFYGVTPGVSHITLLYNTDDSTQVPVNLTLNVDENLNATFV